MKSDDAARVLAARLRASLHQPDVYGQGFRRGLATSIAALLVPTIDHPIWPSFVDAVEQWVSDNRAGSAHRLSPRELLSLRKAVRAAIDADARSVSSPSARSNSPL